MSVEQAMPGRFVRWLSAAAPDWDAVYADQLPASMLPLLPERERELLAMKYGAD